MFDNYPDLTKHNNWMAKCLTPEIYKRLEGKTTSNGNFYICMIYSEAILFCPQSSLPPCWSHQSIENSITSLRVNLTKAFLIKTYERYATSAIVKCCKVQLRFQRLLSERNSAQKDSKRHKKVRCLYTGHAPVNFLTCWLCSSYVCLTRANFAASAAAWPSTVG